ncbi:SRPBCC family protein [Microlunatus sp. Y2014]|uniref:SRPBCC family protein n=1 Tax=Microlunatus sp. Y2014 TaxID=3418488 RepID=UPI003DA6E917
MAGDASGWGTRRHFRFGGEWLVDVPQAAAYEVLADLAHYPDWWPEVRAVARLGPVEARVLVRSRLPYTLDLVLRAERPAGDVLQCDLAGDLVGWARWRVAAEGERTRLTFSQEVEVTGRLLGLAAGIGRPLLVWNHEQMMRSAIRGLPGVVRAGGS